MVTIIFILMLITIGQTLLIIRQHKQVSEARTLSEKFISMAIFQIRAPLTAISGYTSMILEGDYGEIARELRDTMNHMYHSAHTLVGVVNDYIDVSKLELGKLSYNLNPFSLSDALQSVTEEFIPITTSKKISIRVNKENALENYTINADISKIKHAFVSVIDNAVKYTEKGGIEIGIKYTAEDKKHILISIADSGMGIAPEALPKLFEEFNPIEKEYSDSSNIIGSGLGLYLAKTFVVGHNGKIWAHSEGRGKGANFYIELPVS